MTSNKLWTRYKESFRLDTTFFYLILINIIFLSLLVAGINALNQHIAAAFANIPAVPENPQDLDLEHMQLLQSQFENSIGKISSFLWIAASAAFPLIILFAAAILSLLFKPKGLTALIKFLIRFIILDAVWLAAWIALFYLVIRYTLPQRQVLLNSILAAFFIYTTAIFYALSTRNAIPFRKTFKLAIVKFPSLITPFLFAAGTLITSFGIFLFLYFVPPIVYSIVTTSYLVWFLSWSERFILNSLYSLLQHP